MDFSGGRVKPRMLASVNAVVPVLRTTRGQVRLRASVLNLFDRRYACNFGNPFSGTHFGAGRTASVSLQITAR